MTTAAKFPAALVTLANLGGEFPNFPEAVLSGAHNSSVTTITLTATVNAAWPTTGGWVTIDSEIIQYTGVSGATLTSCTRASQGTSAASHSDQAKVGLYLTAATVNQMNAETIALEAFLFQPYWYWMPGIAVENTNTGTGAYATPTNASYGSLSCGATSGSNCGLRKFTYLGAFGTGMAGTFKVRLWSFIFATDKAANEAARLFITDESATGQPSLTIRHLGVKWDGTTFSFSTADGATEQTTDVTANITANTEHRGLVTFDGTTARLYIDGTLRATHATNVPTINTSVTPLFRAHVVNSAAADKLLYVGAQSLWMAP